MCRRCRTILDLTPDEIKELVYSLRETLANNGIRLLKHVKESNNNLQITCPIHSDGQENKPSCGITLIKRDNAPAGYVHCFTCGYTATFEEFVEQCLGEQTDLSGERWINKSIQTHVKGCRKRIDMPWDITIAPQENFISEDILEGYRTFHPYMDARKLSSEVIKRYDVGYDNIMDCLTFPVRNTQGKCTFITRRSVSEKKFYNDKESHKIIYGTYEMDKSANYVIVCESIINCLTAAGYGYNAVALMGLGSATQLDEIRKLPYRLIILALDNDKAGNQAASKIANHIYAERLVGRIIFPEGKDLNDLTKEEFDDIVEKFDYYVQPTIDKK